MPTNNRSDYYTQTSKTPDLFSDFLDDFSPHPISGDISRIKNDQSIKQSLRNLIMTNYGEALFQPNKGCSINKALFEPNDTVASDDLTYHITTTIETSEPRVSLLDVQVLSNVNTDTLNINIVFSIINTNIPQSISLFLKRVR